MCILQKRFQFFPAGEGLGELPIDGVQLCGGGDDLLALLPVEVGGGHDLVKPPLLGFKLFDPRRQGFQLQLLLVGQAATGRLDVGFPGLRLFRFRLFCRGRCRLRWTSQSSYPPAYSFTCDSPSNTRVLVTTLLRNWRS